MTNSNNLLNEVESFINSHICELVSSTCIEELDIKFIFKPVLFNHEKRGHMVCSAPLNSIMERNKVMTENSNKQLDPIDCIAQLIERLNQLIKRKSIATTCDITEKLSHFTQKDGVIILFLADKQCIEELIDYTKDLVNSDEDSSEKATDDQEHPGDDSQESDNDDQRDAESPEVGFNEVSESIFKEIRSSVTSCVNDSNSSGKNVAKLTSSLGESKSKLESNQIKFVNSDSENSNRIKITEKLGVSSTIKSCNSTNEDSSVHMSQESLSVTKASETPETSISDFKITYSESVLEELADLVEQNKFDAYPSSDAVVQAINLELCKSGDCIATKAVATGKTICSIPLGSLMVLFERDGDNIFVVKTVWSPQFEETGTKPTKQWLESLCMVLNIE